MTIASDYLEPTTLAPLSRRRLEGLGEIRSVLGRLETEKTPLRQGVDGGINVRNGHVSRLAGESVWIEADLPVSVGKQAHFEFELDGTRYFLVGTVRVVHDAPSQIVVDTVSLFEAERRWQPREVPAGELQVELRRVGGESATARVFDMSRDGLGVLVRPAHPIRVGESMEALFSREGESERSYAVVKNASRGNRDEWRLGLAITSVPPSSQIEVERRRAILGDGRARAAWRRIRLAGTVARKAVDAVADPRAARSSGDAVRVVEYENSVGQPIRAIVETTGQSPGGTAVLIPPPWNRTKETLAPLSHVLLQTFERAGEPLTVVRFDETNRKGESHIDAQNRVPGRETLNFRFSRAVDDLESSIRFLANHDELAPSKIVLVTFSLAAIAGRRVVATAADGRLAGWVSVVGVPDTQANLRAVSGGIDYAFGLQQGVKFGRREIVGALVDIDESGPDAIAHRLMFFEDAKQDMARIDVPVTWLHGRDDGWIELERVRELVSAGDTSKRRLIEIPTGHQLRTSAEALETFQLVAREASRMALGVALSPAPPRA